MYRSSTIGIGVILLLYGCISMARMDVIKGEGQLIEYNQGHPFVFSGGSKSTVVITPKKVEYELGPRLSFLVRFENHGDDRFDISNGNIEVIGNGISIPILSAQELKKDIQKKAVWAKFGAAFSEAAKSSNSTNTGNTTYSGTTTSSTYGPTGLQQTSGTFQGTVHDPEVARRAKKEQEKRTEEAMASVDAQEKSALEFVESSIIQRTTVRPGDSYQGFFVFNAPVPRNPENTIEVVIHILNDVHRFRFIEKQIK